MKFDINLRENFWKTVFFYRKNHLQICWKKFDSDMFMSSHLTNYLVLDGAYYKIDIWKNQNRLSSPKINSGGGTLINKKEYFLKFLIAGGGELLKLQLLVLSTILCTVCLYLFKIKCPIFFLKNKSIILQEY